MVAPDLTARQMCAVNKVGTDDAGYNAVGAPWSRLTIAAALADLAANYTAATSTNPHLVSIGPGVFTLAATSLPPNVFLQGTADSEGRLLTTIQITGNLSLDSTWAAGAASGGISDCILTSSNGSYLDLTMPAPSSGNPARVFRMENVECDFDTLTFAAAGTGDQLQAEQCRGTATLVTINLTSGTIRLNNLVAPSATATITSGASLAATATGFHSTFSALTLTKGAAALSATFDAASVPLRASLTLNGGAVITLANDARGEAYSPTTPGDWSPGPTTVQGALDTLGTSGGGGVNTFVFIVRTGNRSSAAWGTAGVAINDTANTFTDTTSAGVVATVTGRSFGIPTFAASAATTYTNAASVYIAGDPAAGTNVTITNGYGLWNVGKTRFDGAVLAAAGSAANVAYGFLGDVGTGLFQVGAGLVGLSAGGSRVLAADSGQFTISSTNIRSVNGNALNLGNAAGGTAIYVPNATVHTLLGGLTTDGTGVLQFPAATTSAGGITFGTDTNFYRTTTAGQMALDSAGNTALLFRNGGNNKGYIQWDGTNFLISSKNFPFQLYANDLLAMTLSNTDQSATFAGTITTVAPTGGAGVWKLGKYSAGVLVQAGSVLVNIDGTNRSLLTS